MNFRHLVVGIDFSESSVLALREAVRLASYDSVPITAVYTVDQSVIDYLQEHAVLDESETRTQSEARLAAFVTEHAEGYDAVEARVRVGHPFEELLREVEAQKADLLVMGRRGVTDDPVSVGAVAGKCLRKAPVPVLLAGAGDEQIADVVCCIDYSETSNRVLDYAITMARLHQAELEILHIYMSPAAFQSPESGYVIIGFEGFNDYPERMREKLETFVEPFREKLDALNKVHLTVREHASPGRGIIRHLEDSKCDLLVMGTRGRAGWKSLLLGTTAEHVLHRIPCSSLVIKPQDFDFKVD